MRYDQGMFWQWYHQGQFHRRNLEISDRTVNGLRTLTPISDHLIRVELSRDCFDITSYLSCTTDRTDFLDTTIISPFSVALVGCRTGVGICIVDGRLFGVIYTRSASGWAGAIVDFVNPNATKEC